MNQMFPLLYFKIIFILNNFKFEPVSLSDIEFETGFHRPFNETITKGGFSDILKLADFTPVLRKDYRFDKKVRLASILPTISKIYENLMQRQINNYIANDLSLYL